MVDNSPLDVDCFAPTSETELAEFIVVSAKAGTQLRIAGGSTRIEPWRAQDQAPVLSSRQMAGIVDYEPGALTLIARAGTPLEEIVSLLEREGQALAFEPMDHRRVLRTTGTPTIGGVVGANVSGPRRLAVGACRDHLLGVRFVDGRGRIVKNGGRVMKNVTGLDLTKLVCGSFGTLGMVTEVSLKTAPIPESEETLEISGITATEATTIFSTALATPFEISGAAYRSGTAWLRIQGFAEQLAYRRERLKSLFGKYLVEVFDGAQSKLHWLGIRDLHHFVATEQPLWQILVKPTDAAPVASALEDLGGATSLDWGGGLVWYSGEAAAADVRRVGTPGHARLIRANGLGHQRFFPPESDYVSRISQALRKTFDPAGIFNSALLDR
ncbi:FAD-binding protein [Rhizobium leguminosarum bv. viciae]|nr:FAD-binding protein [Rhizobium leguminosarum bv. viciae]